MNLSKQLKHLEKMTAIVPMEYDNGNSNPNLRLDIHKKYY